VSRIVHPPLPHHLETTASPILLEASYRIRTSIISWQLGPTATLSTQYYYSYTARLPRVAKSGLPMKYIEWPGMTVVSDLASLPCRAFNRAVMIQTRMFTAAA
jgi:hypothetical protein